MKKTIPLLLACLLIFTAGCSVKEYTPEIPLAFKQRASVSSGDFLYDCEICRNEGMVTVTVLSTSAQGMVMMYDGSALSLEYEGYVHSVDPSSAGLSNTAVLIYEMLACIEQGDASAVKTDRGYRYHGVSSLGEFELLQNKDNSFCSLCVRSVNMNIIFEADAE